MTEIDMTVGPSEILPRRLRVMMKPGEGLKVLIPAPTPTKAVAFAMSIKPPRLRSFGDEYCLWVGEASFDLTREEFDQLSQALASVLDTAVPF